MVKRDYVIAWVLGTVGTGLLTLIFWSGGFFVPVLW